MRLKVEGLLIHKILFKEKHLVGRLLLRSGKKISVLFYGGKGLDIGHMLAVELSRTKSTQSLYKAKEWSMIWAPLELRGNYEAFSLMCLFFEILNKFALEENLHDLEDSQQIGLFRIASVGVFSLEQNLKKGTFKREEQLLLFLGKFLLEQGIFPKMNTCIFCDEKLDRFPSIGLVFERGGFACSFCNEDSRDKGIWEFLMRIRAESYLGFNLKSFNFQNVEEFSQILFRYFCFQFELDHKIFKALPSVF
jgi:hypothetical protein